MTEHAPVLYAVHAVACGGTAHRMSVRMRCVPLGTPHTACPAGHKEKGEAPTAYNEGRCLIWKTLSRDVLPNKWNERVLSLARNALDHVGERKAGPGRT